MLDNLAFYNNISIDKAFVEKILSLNYNDLDSISDLDLSKYCIMLSQYLVYFRWQLNKTKANNLKLKNKLEATLFHLLTPDTLKKHKTKTDAKAYMINNVSELLNINQKIEMAEYELLLSDGLDKPIQEMINVFKREQSRRENEASIARFERR